jgi:hypothetical protein
MLIEKILKNNFMNERTEKDFWIEMSISEISTQINFAELSYRNINSKALSGNELVFSSIHSFLSHCANVSKMLLASDGENYPQTIGDILGVTKNSNIHNRRFRNHLEHYDERLKDWIREKGINSNIGTYNIGPKQMIQIPNMIFVSHYDPSNNTFTFVNEDFDLGILYQEIQKIKIRINTWLQNKLIF